MKKTNKLSKRLWALLLVVALIVGMFPGQVFAEDTGDGTASETVQTVPEFKVVATRTPVPAAEEEDDAAQDTEQTAEPAVFQYSAVAYYDGQPLDIETVWTAGEGFSGSTQESDVDGKKLLTTQNPVMVVSATYEGMTIEVTCGEDLNGEKTVTWGGTCEVGSVTLGKSFTVSEPELDDGCTTTLAWEFSASEYLSEAEGKYVPVKIAAAGTTLGTWRLMNGETCVAEIPCTGSVSYVELEELAFAIGETAGDTAFSKWYDTPVNVTITCKADVEKSYMPPVTFTAEGNSAGEWSQDENGVWSCVCSVAVTDTLSVGGQSKKVQIDSGNPQIKVKGAYLVGENEAVVSFGVTPSASGIDSVTVNGETVAYEDAGGITASGVKYDGGKIAIRVVGGNGHAASAEIEPQAGLSVEIKDPPILGKDGDTRYVVNGAVIEIEILGATDDNGEYPVTKTVTNDGAELTDVAWSYDSGVWTGKVTVTKDRAIKNLSVTVKDRKIEARTGSDTLNGTFQTDTKAPEINVTAKQKSTNYLDGIYYYQEEVTYTVTVTDESLLNKNDLSLSYVIDGETQVGSFSGFGNQLTAVIQLKNGQTLGGITVTARDTSGNTAEDKEYEKVPAFVDAVDPTVNFSISKNVTKFVTVDNAVYAYVDAALTQDNKVIIYAEVSDDNMQDLATLNPDWTFNGKEWEYEVTVEEYATMPVELTFTVIDKAKNMPAEALVMESLASTEDYQVLTNIALTRDDEGKYTGGFNLDRRYPSGGVDDTPPTIELKPGTDLTMKDGTTPVFRDEISFDVVITDISAGGADSGVADVKWALKTQDGNNTLVPCEGVAEDGKYTITGTVGENYEAKDLILEIMVSDKVGNAFTYNYTFAVDNKAPEVTVKMEPDGGPNKTITEDGTNIDCYNDRVTYTFGISDLFLTDPGVTMAEVRYIFLDGTNGTLDLLAEGEKKIVVAEGQTLTDMAVSVKDASGNVTTTFGGNVSFNEKCEYDGNDVRVDAEPPVLNVTMVPAEGAALIGVDGVDYYSDDVVFTFSVSDKHIGNGVASVVYSLEDGTTESIDLLEKDNYTGSFTLSGVQVLTKIMVTVQDDAGNPVAAESLKSNIDFTIDGNALTYNGKKIAIDSDVPVVDIKESIEKAEGESYRFVRSDAGHDYYNGLVTYDITISDKFLEEGLYKADVTVVFEDGTSEVKELALKKSGNGVAGVDTLSAQIVVENGKPIETFKVVMTDMMGRAVELGKVTEEDKEVNPFITSTSEGIAYGGNVIVVDKTAPVIASAEITAAGASGETDYVVTQFYQQGESFYACITPEVEKSSVFEKLEKLFGWNESTPGEDVTLTLTFTLEETNPNAKALTEAGWTYGEDGVWSHVTTVTVPEGKTAELVIDLAAKDMADNVPADEVVLESEGKASDGFVSSITLVPDNGVYSKTIQIDRLTPETSGEPEVQLRDVEGKDLHGSSYSYELTVTDGGSGVKKVEWTLDDGLENVDFLSTNGNGNGNPSANGKYNIQVNINEDVYAETGKATLTITVEDNVGNIYTYINTFSVDNLGPRINVEKTTAAGTGYQQSIKDHYEYKDATEYIDYYNGEVTYTITVEDMFTSENAVVYSYMDNGQAAEGKADNQAGVQKEVVALTEGETEEGLTVYSGTIVVKQGQILTDIQISSTDLVGNTSALQVSDSDEKTTFVQDGSTWKYNGNDVAVNMTKPQMTVTKTVKDVEYKQTGKGVNYYGGETEGTVVYTVQVTDDCLTDSADGFQDLTMTYTFEQEDAVTVKLSSKAEDGEAWAYDAETNTYSYDIVVTDGKLLTGIEVYAVDNAGNWIDGDAVSIVGDAEQPEEYVELSFQDQDGDHRWSAAPMTAVDNTPATVTVTRTVEKTDTSEPVQTYNGYDYYDAKVTYTIHVEDTFLNEGLSTAAVMIDYMKDDADTEEIETITRLIDLYRNETAASQVGNKPHTQAEVYEGSFTVVDGKAIMGMRIAVIDNAGNITKVIDVGEDDYMSFSYSEEDNEEKVNVYTGNSIIVDMTAPAVTLSVTGDNVDKFYTYNGTTYVKLKDPASGLSGAAALGSAEKVTLTLEVTDMNLTLDEKNAYAVRTNLEQDDSKWENETSVNTESTVTYVKTIEVKPDSTGVFEVDISVFDLAGHTIGVDDVEVKAINGTIPSLNVVEEVKDDATKAIIDGRFAVTISLDRRRPGTTVNDNQAPEISLVDPENVPIYTSSNQRDLFGQNFSYGLTITDGEDSKYNSGISRITWSVTDANGTASGGGEKTYQDGQYADTFDIPVKLADGKESNEVKLTITAVDKVGNQTTYVKELAADTLSPRIKVTYTNNNVRNEKYFKEDRTAVITVEDINFIPEEPATKITTQVTPTAWQEGPAGTWTCSCYYGEDGEYTFAIESTDLANNKTADNPAIYAGNQARQEFVIDKTAPVINVTFDPGQVVDRDDQGVLFYDREQTVTVAITEVNFRAADVTATFSSNNSLSAWRDNGDLHNASAHFAEGNNYDFSIAYVDLAGNEAQSYNSDTFSVDLTAPTIEITRGDMTNESLNIVQGDLVLGLTINDAQSNLKNCSVKVTRLNNEFKEETVVESSDYYTISKDGTRTNITVNFANIAKLKENDGIYTVSITASDYAGHVVRLSPDLVFSLNRFGSTFMTDDAFTSQFLTSGEYGGIYHQSVDGTLVIKEINPNKVWQDDTRSESGSTITIAVNGRTTPLTKGVDYKFDVKEEGEGDNKWYIYTYEIDPSNFLNNAQQEDGSYSILIYGVDEAGNRNTNESNEFSSVRQDENGEYTGKIEFMLDNKAPVISILGVEANEDYDAANRRMEILVSDNSPVSIQVYLNSQLVELSESMEGLSDDAVWLAVDPETGNYVLNITQQNSRQDVQIIALDAAGNSETKNIENIMVNTNALIRLLSNPVFVGGLIAVLLGLIIFFILLLKRRKKEESAEKQTV